MAIIDSIIDVNATVRDPNTLIYNVQIEQVQGTDDQARVTFSIPSTLQTGTLYARFKSNHNPAHGKQEIDGVGGFPIVQPVAGLGSGNTSVTMVSSANLTIGTDYVALIYWVEDGFSGNHWDGLAGDVFPELNALAVSQSLTLQPLATPPADISPNTISTLEGTASGTLIGTLSADIGGCTFSELAPDLGFVNLAANGQVTITQGQAPAVGSYTLRARATNSVGSFDEDISVTVAPVSGTGGGGTPLPGVNTETAGSLSALQTILGNLETNWNATMAGYGLSASDEPVIGLASGQHGAMNLSNRDFRGRQRVTIRGTGSFSRDGWSPLAGTKVGRLTVSGCHNIRLMGVEAEVNSGSHEMTNSTFCSLVRNVIMDGIARSTSAAAGSPQVSSLLLLKGSSDCEISHNAVLGGSARQIGAINATNSRIRIEGNVFDQPGGDNININGGINNDWEVHDNLGSGRARNPKGTHQDLIQIFAPSGGTAIASFWNCTGNVLITKPSWGNDSHAANQMFWWGGGSHGSQGNTFINNFAGNTNGMVKGRHGNGGVARFNSQAMMVDPNSTEANTYSASWGGCEDAANADENIVPQKALSITKGAGPNGIHIYMPNSKASDLPGPDWTPQDAFYTRTPTRADTFGQFRPKTGTRAHWTHSDPTGCFQLFMRLFDSSTHDHWKDKGWPVAPMVHIAYDPNNELGGASGTYQNFDANGSYMG